MDYILTQKCWRNSIKDAEAKIGRVFESDHKVMLPEIRIKLAAKQKEKIKKRNKNHRTNRETERGIQ